MLLYLTEFIIFATTVGHCERVDYQLIAATSVIDLVPCYFSIVHYCRRSLFIQLSFKYVG
jgi:hypothetical protein